MIEKVLTSAIIVIAPKVMPYPSAILLSIFLLYMILVIWKYPSM
jgi:hypothetical protein